MGPLLPQNIINGDLNFFFALIIGIGFGFILEQAGFSSSRKLAGVFYGYDFVVLKVFFTAGITAAIGIFFFDYFGWIDMNFVYINPLFLYSAIIGGVIMGIGFILGGFCPGTSIAAAAIGKIDAIVFVLGIFIGVFIFGYFYDVFENIYLAKNMGDLRVHDALGLSQAWFLFALILMALTAFIITQKIENKSNKFKELLNIQKLNVNYSFGFVIILAIITVLLPQQKKTYLHEVSKIEIAEKLNDKSRLVSAQQLAHHIIHDANKLLIIDLRTKQEYDEFHLPTAINIQRNDVILKENKKTLQPEDKMVIFYSNGAQDAELAWFMATRAGLKNLHVLDGGLNKFFDVLFGEIADFETKDIRELSDRRFIAFARKFFQDGEVYQRKHSGGEVSKDSGHTVKAVKGGC
ncbi:MAG: YeeE/YedE family protein [Bacteroidales bacterium]|jgi:rhodanese-related sulfurtransferase/uncharacterized membrane protein YedE/YeeE|nr:rhodanese-like domain-containing protein [Bacteroidales bacterium]MCK9499859.1 rhodanese-like domain-containing protein [Bacteroidales bacterium]MDY0315400.1 YeeE/YedE thiosulfate transporter family protein [Bacteroidales bacterium]NLB86771.1 YeeE/YedE family protein [Bacteroidales bacterium]